MKNSLLSRHVMLLGHLCMLALLVLSMWFAEERVLLIDSAYQLFYDINHESILINDNRFSMVLSQLIPWLLIKLHVPLRYLIIVYSVGFILIAWCCYWVASCLLDNRQAAILMVFSLLGMRATFFHCLSETFQLMFYAPLLYALLVTSKRGWWYWPSLLFVEALAVFIHPIALFFVLFIVGFRLIHNNRLKIDAGSVVVMLWMIILLVSKALLGTSGHDQSFLPTHESLQYALANFFQLNSIKFFYIHFPDLYLFPMLLWIITLVGYIRNSQWLKLAFVGLFVPAFFAMSVIVYWQGDGPIGMERTYLPLFFFIGLAFIEDELKRLTIWPQRVVFILFAVLLLVRFVSIGMSSRPYANRMAEIERIAMQARDQGIHKLLVTKSTAEEIFPINIWGLALESMMYTARDGADRAVTIYIEENDFDRTDSLYSDTDVYVAVNWWKRWPIEDLNSHYFSLPPQGYKLLVVKDGSYSFEDL